MHCLNIVCDSCLSHSLQWTMNSFCKVYDDIKEILMKNILLDSKQTLSLNKILKSKCKSINDFRHTIHCRHLSLLIKNNKLRSCLF